MGDRVTVSSCKNKLSAKGYTGSGQVFFEGRYLGRFVTHGHRSGNGKTVYASRIVKPFRIQVKGASHSSMLNKIASKLAKVARDKGLSYDEIGKEAE